MYLNVSKAKVESKRIKADSSTAGRGYNPISHDLMECWTGLDGLNGLLLPIHMSDTCSNAGLSVALLAGTWWRIFKHTVLASHVVIFKSC